MRIIKSFIFGLLAALGALCIELVISNLYFILSGEIIETNYFIGLTFFLIIVVLTEEIFKYIALAKSYSTINMQPPKIYTALIFGLGFSSIEIFFLLDRTLPPYSTYLDLRLWSIILLHVATTVTIGTLLLKKNFSALRIISISFCLHLIYNLMVIYNLNYFIIYAYLGFIALGLAILNPKFDKTKI